MRTIIFALTGISGLLIAGTSAAEPSTTAQTTVQAQSGADQAQPATVPVQPTVQAQATVSPAATDAAPDEIVCRTVAATTGTRLGAGHECHTEQEWEEIQRTQRSDMRQVQRQGGFAAGH